MDYEGQPFMNSTLIGKVRERGVRGVARAVAWRGRSLFHRLRGRSWRLFHRLRSLSAPRYRSPTEDQLETIERELKKLGVNVADLSVSPEEFKNFRDHIGFPLNYHGGVA